MQEVLKTPETEEVEAPKFVTPKQIKAMVFEVIKEKEAEDENFFVPENWEPDFDKFFESSGNVNHFVKKVCDAIDDSKKDITEENWEFLESIRDRVGQKIRAAFNPKKTEELRSWLKHLEDEGKAKWNVTRLLKFKIGKSPIGGNLYRYCYRNYEDNLSLMIPDFLPQNEAQKLLDKFTPGETLEKKVITKKPEELRSFLNYLEDEKLQQWNTSELKNFKPEEENIGMNLYQYCQNHYECDLKKMIGDLLPGDEAQQLIEKFKSKEEAKEKVRQRKIKDLQAFLGFLQEKKSESWSTKTLRDFKPEGENIGMNLYSWCQSHYECDLREMIGDLLPGDEAEQLTAKFESKEKVRQQKIKDLQAFLGFLQEEHLIQWDVSKLKNFKPEEENIGPNLYSYCQNHYECDLKKMIGDLLPGDEAQQLIEKFKSKEEAKEEAKEKVRQRKIKDLQAFLGFLQEKKSESWSTKTLRDFKPEGENIGMNLYQYCQVHYEVDLKKMIGDLLPGDEAEQLTAKFESKEKVRQRKIKDLQAFLGFLQEKKSESWSTKTLRDFKPEGENIGMNLYQYCQVHYEVDLKKMIGDLLPGDEAEQLTAKFESKEKVRQQKTKDLQAFLDFLQEKKSESWSTKTLLGFKPEGKNIGMNLYQYCQVHYEVDLKKMIGDLLPGDEAEQLTAKFESKEKVRQQKTKDLQAFLDFLQEKKSESWSTKTLLGFKPEGKNIGKNLYNYCRNYYKSDLREMIGDLLSGDEAEQLLKNFEPLERKAKKDPILKINAGSEISNFLGTYTNNSEGKAFLAEDLKGWGYTEDQVEEKINEEGEIELWAKE